jgi:CDP-diacylglycerol--serine O-phosphatidyltransferase
LKLVLVYTLFIGFMMVSTIPTYSGKLLGERVGREWVLPIFILAIGFVAMLATYPYETLAVSTIAYLAFIPLSWRRFQAKRQEDIDGEAANTRAAGPSPSEASQGTGSATAPAEVSTAGNAPPGASGPAAPNTSQARVFPLRPGEPQR